MLGTPENKTYDSGEMSDVRPARRVVRRRVWSLLLEALSPDRKRQPEPPLLSET
jgi:hypothetical protein